MRESRKSPANIEQFKVFGNLAEITIHPVVYESFSFILHEPLIRCVNLGTFGINILKFGQYPIIVEISLDIFFINYFQNYRILDQNKKMCSLLFLYMLSTEQCFDFIYDFQRCFSITIKPSFGYIKIEMLDSFQNFIFV